MSIGSVIHSTTSAVKPHMPVILTSLSCVGVVATSVMCAKNTLTAVDIIRQYEGEVEAGEVEDSKKERIKRVLPAYIPTVLIGGATIACAIGAHTTGRAQTAALASAYTIAQEAAGRYRDKVVETVGEKKAKEIDDKVADEIIKQNPPTNQTIVVGSGKVMCYDTLSGRYFSSDIESLRKVQNDMNKIVLDDGWISLNDFYYRIGLEPMNLGEELGWSTDQLIELKFSSRLDDHSTPCLVVDYDHQPKAEFYRRY